MATVPGSQLGTFSHKAKGVGAVLHSDWGQGMLPWKLIRTLWKSGNTESLGHLPAQGTVTL